MLLGTIRIIGSHVLLYDGDGALQAELVRSPKLIWLCAMLYDVEPSILQAELSAGDALDLSRWLLQKQAQLLGILRRDLTSEKEQPL